MRSEPKSSFGISTAKHSQLSSSLNAVLKGNSRLAELRSVLVVGTLIAVTILLGSWGLYWREASTIEHHLLIQEANGVDLQVQVFVRELQSAANQLLLLADGDALRSFLESSDPAELEHATQRAVFVGLQQDRFDQLRFLNENGREVIRVNQGGQVVPPTELQNKSDQPYFKKTWVLNSGQLYLSGFDLNIERDRIEIPHKPVIRIATPVFDQSGRRRGVYVTNYLGSALLDQPAGGQRVWLGSRRIAWKAG